MRGKAGQQVKCADIGCISNRNHPRQALPVIRKPQRHVHDQPARLRDEADLTRWNLRPGHAAERYRCIADPHAVGSNQDSARRPDTPHSLGLKCGPFGAFFAEPGCDPQDRACPDHQKVIDRSQKRRTWHGDHGKIGRFRQVGHAVEHLVPLQHPPPCIDKMDAATHRLGQHFRCGPMPPLSGNRRRANDGDRGRCKQAVDKPKSGFRHARSPHKRHRSNWQFPAHHALCFFINSCDFANMEGLTDAIRVSDASPVFDACCVLRY